MLPVIYSSYAHSWDTHAAQTELLPIWCSVAIAAMFWLGASGAGVRAHEGHDHAALTNLVATSLPRIAVQSELYQVVGILEGGRLTLYLDRFSDNAPVTSGRIAVTVDGEAATTTPAADGTVVVTSTRFAGNSSVELVFDISGSDGDDLLIGTLALRSPSGNAASDASWPARIVSAVRHAGEDHLILVIVTLMVGTMFGLAVRGWRRRAAAAAVLLTSALVVSSARAHEGHDHGDQARALAPSGDTAQRLPGGQLFVPKPMQRILDVRTLLAKSETAAKAVVLVGRVITDPDRSGIVQSIHGGRVIAPEGGLPRLGKTVTRGDVLALIEHAIPAADRTTISERLGEIDQLIAVAETRLARLKPLAERGAVPQSQIIDLETELVGLRKRRDTVLETRITPEVLRAPIDGVIATARVLAGQVVQAQDLLFQIVDPASLWIEAFDYGDLDPSTLKEATAAATGGKLMKLVFQGFSRALQQQATVLQFSVIDPPPAIRVGQPVTVTAKSADEVTGIIISRNAVVRGANGETIVWRHVEPERFEARLVRTEPFDAANVLITAGIAPGDRIVVRGAELINQIR